MRWACCRRAATCTRCSRQVFKLLTIKCFLLHGPAARGRPPAPAAQGVQEAGWWLPQLRGNGEVATTLGRMGRLKYRRRQAGGGNGLGSLLS